MPPIRDGQYTKQSVADFFGWNAVPDLPEPFTCRAYYNSQNNTYHVVDSTGAELLLTMGTAVTLSPIADQTIAGPFGLVFAPGGYVQVKAVLFSQLPAASSSLEGVVRAVSDSNTATWGATIAGGGSNHVLAYCNGTNWTVAAK